MKKLFLVGMLVTSCISVFGSESKTAGCLSDRLAADVLTQCLEMNGSHSNQFCAQPLGSCSCSLKHHKQGEPSPEKRAERARELISADSGRVARNMSSARNLFGSDCGAETEGERIARWQRDFDKSIDKDTSLSEGERKVQGQHLVDADNRAFLCQDSPSSESWISHPRSSVDQGSEKKSCPCCRIL